MRGRRGKSVCVAAKHRGAEWTRGDGDMGDFFAEVHPCWAVHIEVRPVVVSSLRHLAGTKLGGTTGPPTGHWRQVTQSVDQQTSR